MSDFIHLFFPVRRDRNMAAEPRSFDAVWANIPVFSGETDLGHAHEKMEDLVGFGVWVDDFNPASVPHRRAIDSLLRFLDSKGVCCVISGLYPAFMVGRIKLSPPASNTARFKPTDFWARLYIASDDTFETQPVRQLLERGPTSGEVKYGNLTIKSLSADCRVTSGSQTTQPRSRSCTCL
jgi:hypothetical protein